MSSFLATAEPDNDPPRVALQLNWPDAGPVTVERLDPDARWRPVRTADPATFLETWIGYDYEAPYGELFSYRATSVSGEVINAGPEAGTVVSAAFPGFEDGFGVLYNPDGSVAHYDLRLDVSRAWLIHPGVPSRSCPVRVVSVSERVRAARRATFDVLNRKTPVVASQPRKSPTFEVKLRTLDATEGAGLDIVLDDGSPLLLNIPAPLGWALGSTWLSVGDVTTTPYDTQHATDHRLVWTLPVIEVDRPSTSRQVQWTFALLRAERLTFADLAAGYATFGDLSAHTSRAAAAKWTFATLAAEEASFALAAADYASFQNLAAHQPA